MSLALNDGEPALSGPDVSAEDGGCSNASASAEEQVREEARMEGAVQVEDNDEDTNDEASGGGLSNASPTSLSECTQATVEVEAAAGPSAQLEGSTEDIQTQALMQAFNSKAIPQVRVPRINC